MPRWLFFPASNFIPDGEFTYCELSATIVNSMRPVDTVNGQIVYCSFNLNTSGFNRTP